MKRKQYSEYKIVKPADETVVLNTRDIRKVTLKEIICQECKGKVKQKRRHQKFCSAKCRLDNWLRLHPRIVLQKEQVEELQKLKLLGKKK